MWWDGLFTLWSADKAGGGKGTGSTSIFSLLGAGSSHPRLLVTHRHLFMPLVHLSKGSTGKTEHAASAELAGVHTRQPGTSPPRERLNDQTRHTEPEQAPVPTVCITPGEHWLTFSIQHITKASNFATRLLLSQFHSRPWCPAETPFLELPSG